MILELLTTEKRSAIERWVRSNTHSTAMPNGDTLCRVLGEWPMVVTLGDLSVAPHFVLDGYWEMWVTMCLAKQFAKSPHRQSWHCIDVGANLGYYTLLLAHLAPGGRVEAWEPQLGLCERLQKTLRLNGLGDDRVRIRSAALGAEAADARVEFDKSDRGSARVRLGSGGGVAVRPVTDTTLERVDFMKIDAEGMEPEIWRGGIGLLKPKAILLEWSPEKYADPPEFMGVIRGDGYAVSLVNEHGELTPVKTPEEHAALSGIRGWRALWLERSTG